LPKRGEELKEIYPLSRIIFSSGSSDSEWKSKMRITQVNISNNDYNDALDHRTVIKNEIQGGNFSFTPSEEEIYPP
jgi:hypothetical protein